MDASWSEESDWNGLVFILLEDDKLVCLGLESCPKGQSPLHAEKVESDCQQLVNTIWKDEDWLALAPELYGIRVISSSFQVMSFAFISRV